MMQSMMATAMASPSASSSADEHANNSSNSFATDKLGKYRLMAEIKRLEQEAKYLEEELVELDTTEYASSVCNEFLPSVEPRPDALLPLTSGPVNPLWNRWFEGFQDSEGCRCCIM